MHQSEHEAAIFVCPFRARLGEASGQVGGGVGHLVVVAWQYLYASMGQP